MKKRLNGRDLLQHEKALKNALISEGIAADNWSIDASVINTGSFNYCMIEVEVFRPRCRRAVTAWRVPYEMTRQLVHWDDAELIYNMDSSIPSGRIALFEGLKVPQVEEVQVEEVRTAPEKPNRAMRRAAKRAAKKDRPGYYSLKIRNKFNAAFRTAIQGVKSGNVSQVHISAHNSKMGYVASVSLLPFNSCPALCAGTCGKDCYAAKLANLRPNVLQDYAENMSMAMFRRDEYFAQVNLAMAGVRFFRYHVGGDFPDADYFDRVVMSAVEHPHCEVLAFTKRWEIVNNWIAEHGDLPGNLHIMFSGWTGLKPVNPYGLPETNIIERGCDPGEGWTICGGNCFNCGLACSGCFGAQCGDVIAFHKH